MPAPRKMSKAAFSGWIRQRIASRTPSAVVRFGDGEERLLAATPDDAESMRIANRHLNGETGRAHSPEAVLQVRSALERAGREADVLGIPGDLEPMAMGDANPLVALVRERAKARPPTLALASSMVNHQILAELPELVDGLPVSVISCRDVRPVIEVQWGVEDVAVYPVPSQYRARDVDSAYEAVLHDVPIWPDAYDRICSELTVRERGEVFLVGAGVFGKDLCIRVRDQGGIALDMGSALDHIVGKLTRTRLRRIHELHSGGMSPAEIAADTEARVGGSVDSGSIVDFIDGITPYVS